MYSERLSKNEHSDINFRMLKKEEETIINKQYEWLLYNA